MTITEATPDLGVLPERDWVTIQEIAAYLRVCPRTVDRRLLIPYVRFGKVRRYRRKDVLAFIEKKVS